jgi:hypothetical protein
VLLGVDPGEAGPAVPLGQPAGGIGRGVAGVVPTLEAGDQHGPPQLRPVLPDEPIKLSHCCKLTTARYPFTPRSWLKSTG